VRRPNWTERDGARSNGAYLIETLTHDLWVLSRGSGRDWEILTTAASASELEAFTTIHRRVSGAARPLILGAAYLVAVAGVIAGSVTGSSVAVLFASAVTVAVMAKLAEYLTGRRAVRSRMPASIR
jgi:hypothetical protein